MVTHFQMMQISSFVGDLPPKATQVAESKVASMEVTERKVL